MSMNRTHDETSETLLAAAHRLLVDMGPESLTVRRIATEAGMSTMNVYSRFGGKDGVIDELYADGYRRLVADVKAVPVTDNILGDIDRVAQTYRDFALQNPTYYRIMFRLSAHGFEPSQESAGLGVEGISSLIGRVRAGQDDGTIADADTDDCDEIAGWLWATCHGLVSLELDGVGDERLDWPTVFEKGMRRSINALRPAQQQVPIR